MYKYNKKFKKMILKNVFLLKNFLVRSLFKFIFDNNIFLK